MIAQANNVVNSPRNFHCSKQSKQVIIIFHTKSNLTLDGDTIGIIQSFRDLGIEFIIVKNRITHIFISFVIDRNIQLTETY